MGGGTFILLKTGRYRPKSAKQAESRLAILLKILRIWRSRKGVPDSSRLRRKGHAVVVVRIPSGMANLPGSVHFVI